MDVRKEGTLAFVGNEHTEYTYKYSEEEIAFGASVMRGTDVDNQCKNMVTGGKFLGIAKAFQKNTKDTLTYPAKFSVEIITRGKVWVKVSSAVKAGDVAAVGENGKIAKTGTSTYDDINGVFETSAENGEYAILNLK